MEPQHWTNLTNEELVYQTEQNPNIIGDLTKQLLKDIELFHEQALCLAFGTVKTNAAILTLQKNAPTLGVCGRTFEGKGEVAWKCEDCGKDPASTICQECFSKSDHKGHRVRLRRNIYGMCDCGDANLWNPSNFCSDHKQGASPID